MPSKKREAYLSINTLCVYVLLEHSCAFATVFRRDDNGFMREIYDDPAAILPLPEIDGQLSLQEVYDQVTFPEPDDSLEESDEAETNSRS